jgi:hypothetical protein
MPQSEKVILEAEDEVTPVVGKANASLESFEQKAESSHGKVIRITDQTRTSIQRLISSLEKQAETYGKSGVEKLITQRDSLLQRYAKEPQAIDQITKSYEKMIAVEQKAASEALAAKAAKQAEEALQKQSAAIKALGSDVTTFMQNPLQGAQGAISRVTAAIGPMGVGIVAGGAALAAIAISAFEAAKSLGQYGVQVKDAELRTGLTANEVVKFGFVARLAGQDVSIFERMMRGLTTAVEDDSKAGEKARGWLQRFGVDIGGVKEGTVATSQVLQQIAAGLDQLPTTWDRNKAAMDLFKKAGIEAIPVIEKLSDGLKTAAEENVHMSEADVARYEKLNQEITILETHWEALKRDFKEGLVIEVKFVGEAAGWLLKYMPGETVDYDQQKLEQRQQLENEIRQANAMKGKWGPHPLTGIAELQHQRMLALQDLRPYDAFDQEHADSQVKAKLEQAERYAGQIVAAQKGIAAAAAAENKKQIEAAGSRADQLRSMYFGGHDALEKAYNQAKKDVEQYQEELASARAKKLDMKEVEDIGSKLKTASAAEARAKAAMDDAANVTALAAAMRSAWRELPGTNEDRLAAISAEEQEAIHDALEKFKGKAGPLVELLKQVYDLKWLKEYNSEQERTTKEVQEQSQRWEELKAKASKASGEPFREDIKEGTKRLEEQAKAVAKLAAEWVKLNQAGESQALAHQKRMIQINGNPDDPMAVLAAQQALDLGQINERRQAALSDLSSNPVEAIEQRAVAEKEAANAVGELRYQWEEKLAEFQKKTDQERIDKEQRQQDAIAKTAGGLFHTLLTKPQSFPKQLRTTLEDAALKPVTETLGGAVANIVHPVSKQDPLKLATDTNTLATAQNSAAVGNLTAVVAAAAGLSAPGIAGVSIPGISGISLPNISIGTPTGTAGTGSAFAQRLFPNLPRFGQGGVTSGPSIAGEDGPELVIPLDMRPTTNRPLVGQFGPATDAALQKAATALMSVALPMGLTALGGPGGFSLGEWIMSGLTGAVGAATPARHDNVMMGTVPPMGSMKWAINPKTGALRLSSFAGEDAELETHTDWFAKIGLPDSGPAFDKIPRGSVSIDKGKLRILDNAWEDDQRMSPAMTSAQFDALVKKLQERFPGAQLETYRDPATGGWVVNKAPKVNAEPIPILFNKTMDNIKAVGRKGGIASGLARKRRALEMAEEQQFSDAIYTGPEPGPFETTREAAAKLDEQYPWLKDAFSAANKGKVDTAAAQAARRKIAAGLNLPQYDDGGTVATTGVAVVHQGEAVVPQADSLKHSIDGLSGTMQSNTTAIRSLLYVMVGRSLLMPGATAAPWAGSGPAASSSQSVDSSAPWAGTGAAASSSEAVGYSLASWAGTSTGTSSSWAGTGTAGRSQDSLALAMKMFDPAAVQKTGTTTSLIQSLKNFKTQDWGGFTRAAGTTTYGTDAQGSDVATYHPGGITGVHGTAGQALDYGGMMLATQGLLGSRMGTWGGVGEGAAGGAMIGMQMGGPLGAVIGGVAGFGIGVGEKIAGVESPQVKAHNDIKSIYGVDIPTNSGTIKQVVQIADSQFGKDIAVAVRSPSVRQLVMLYSEATGQKMPLSAATPYAGSLVESGGNLYQQASFQNNAWHTYSSNLPTLGGIGGTTYPTTPGPNTAAGAGPTYLSLNINGQPITADFVADQSMAAQNASYGRTQQSANLQVPGLMVA